MSRYAVSWGLGLLGAAVGGVLGFYLVGWLLSQNFYGMLLPGGLLGVGCGLLSRHTSTARGAVCGLAGLALGLFCEWHYLPFRDNKSLTFFLKHLPDVSPVSMLMIIGGGVLAFWFGRDQFRVTRERPPEPPKT